MTGRAFRRKLKSAKDEKCGSNSYRFLNRWLSDRCCQGKMKVLHFTSVLQFSFTLIVSQPRRQTRLMKKNKNKIPSFFVQVFEKFFELMYRMCHHSYDFSFPRKWVEKPLKRQIGTSRIYLYGLKRKNRHRSILFGFSIWHVSLSRKTQIPNFSVKLILKF